MAGIRTIGLRVAAIAAGLGLASQAQAANVLANAGFETGALSPWYQSRDFDLPGLSWTVDNADAHSGTYSALVEGNREIRQDFAAVAGSSITEVSFWIRHVNLSFAPAFVTLFYADATEDGFIVATSTTQWQKIDVTSHLNTAKSLVALGIFGYSGGGASDFTRVDDLLVDASRIAVPEPATWALMIAGFGLAGGALRRRTVAA